MAKTNGAKTESTAKPPAVAESDVEVEDAIADSPDETLPEPTTPSDGQEIEDCLNALKTLLSTVEKLQKVRQEVGDIKPLLVRMLDGEVLTGDELEQLKTGVGGLFKLVRAYGDHQTALGQAQPARTLLDQVLKPVGK
jgi:hypothetical protein